MPRTESEIARTDRLAADISYRAPPADIEPAGLMGEDPKWHALVYWFDWAGVSWDDGLLVYISRRYNQSIQEAYIATDNFVKAEVARRARLEDPDAIVSFN